MATLLVSTGLFATKAAASAALTNTAVSVGLGLVQRALTPDQVIKQQGPRLAQSQITGATEGAVMPRIAGSMRIGGQLIWATTFRETIVQSTQSQGGKGGPKAVTQTTSYVYDTSFAVGLCEANGDVTLGRIWMDGNEIDTSNVVLRFYDGSQDQPDSKIEVVEGVGTVPAFTGTAYLVFENLELTDYGNRIPQVTVEVVRSVTLLSAIVTEVCQRVGVSADVSAIAAEDVTIEGMIVGDLTSPRSVLENLMRMYLFDAVEDQGTLRFFYTKTSEPRPFDLDDTIPRNDTDSLIFTRAQDEDLPDRTQVDFLDAARDYNTASVDGHTVTGASRRVSSIASLTTLGDGYARAIADVITHEAWIARDGVSFSVPFGSPATGYEYLSMKPGTTVTIGEKSFRVVSRLLGDEIEVEAVGFAADIYTPVEHVTGLSLETGTVEFGPSTILFAELPLLSAESAAPYSPRVIAYQDPWPIGVAVYRDDGSGGELLNTTVLVSGVIGQTVTSFDYGAPFMWDDANTVTVSFTDPDYNPSSVSDASVLAGANTLAVLTPSGEWEVFQFANATLNPDGTYTLSRLLRGQLGTEPYIGSPTPAGSTVILYSEGRWGTLSGTNDLIGTELDLRYGPASDLVSDPKFQDILVTPRGVAYRPYAPGNPTQSKDISTGDITLSWRRRSRFDGDSWETEVVPLNEDFEKYRVKIYDGAALVRTRDVDDATATLYTEAEQIEDFGAGQPSITWTVQQVSAIFGAGSIANG